MIAYPFETIMVKQTRGSPVANAVAQAAGIERICQDRQGSNRVGLGPLHDWPGKGVEDQAIGLVPGHQLFESDGPHAVPVAGPDGPDAILLHFVVARVCMRGDKGDRVSLCYELPDRLDRIALGVIGLAAACFEPLKCFTIVSRVLQNDDFR